MPIAKFSALQKLISSLTKAEKRHFVLYVNRLESNKGVLFVRLFNLMENNEERAEAFFFKKLQPITKAQFLYTKRHLYSQLLKSLRLVSTTRSETFKIRQKLDYADMLYSRGLYYESLAILNTIKEAEKESLHLLHLEVAELKKKIESRHITRSRKNRNRMESLIEQSNRLQSLTNIESNLSGISLEVQGLYIKWGFAKNERDTLIYQVYFKSKIPSYEYVRPSIQATVLWHQSHVWFHYMNLNFHYTYRHAMKWVLLMEQEGTAFHNDPDLYMRGYHYILTSCFYLNREDKYLYWYQKYKLFRKEHMDTFNPTTLLLDFCYYDNAEINQMIIRNRYPKLSDFRESLEAKILKLSDKLDFHRILMFYYKLGMIYSYRGEYEMALEYFNKIIDQPDKQLRNDIFSYARLIQLMCHYRINNFNLVLNLLPSVRATFENNNRMNAVVEQIISFLRRGSNALNFGIQNMISSSVEKVEAQRSHQYNKVAFLYYDFSTWLLSIGKSQSIERIKKDLG